MTSRLGKLIVLEGIDGAGTSTQAKLLADALKKEKFKVLESKEPTDGEIGLFIRKTLQQPIVDNLNLLTMLALCFAADRMKHINDVITPGLLENDFILLDRYLLSSLVYQGLHLPKKFISDINQYAIKPDLTIIINVDVEIALKRLSKRANKPDFFEKKELLVKLKQDYLSYADDKNVFLVDGNNSEEKVLEDILKLISSKA